MVEQINRAVHVVRAEHHVDPWRFVAHDVFVFLGEAPCHDNLSGGFGIFPGFQRAERAVELHVCVLANAAGVEHDDVGFGFASDGFHAVVFEQTGDALGVVLVHLTAERAHHVTTSHSA